MEWNIAHHTHFCETVNHKTFSLVYIPLCSRCACLYAVCVRIHIILRLFTMHNVWLVRKLGGGCRIVSHIIFYVFVEFIYKISQSTFSRFQRHTYTRTHYICGLECFVQLHAGFVAVCLWRSPPSHHTCIWKSFSKCLCLLSVRFLIDIVVVRFCIQLMISSPSD